MSENASKSLLIDVGNSRCKYAWHQPAGSPLNTEYAKSVEQLASSIQHANEVLLSSVNNGSWTEQISQICQHNNVALKIIEVQSVTMGLKCAYENYHTLGVDRWLAMLAVNAICDKPFVVIDAGTAITCDFVAHNQHLGGWIAPGFDLMRNALQTNTSKVFTNQHMPSELAWGKKTEDCVNLGCLASLQGSIAMANTTMRQHYSDYQVFLSGGSSIQLEQTSEQPSIVRLENVVLSGLSLFAEF